MSDNPYSEFKQFSYTYFPEFIAQNDGHNSHRVRFELGDVMVEGGSETCYLSDEEINAVLEVEPTLKRALYRLADAVCMRLSYETDWRDDGTQFSLSQRAERWMKLRDRFKKEADAESTLPMSGAVCASVQNARDGGHYFYSGMMQNPLVQPSFPHRGGRR